MFPSYLKSSNPARNPTQLEQRSGDQLDPNDSSSKMKCQGDSEIPPSQKRTKHESHAPLHEDTINLAINESPSAPWTLAKTAAQTAAQTAAELGYLEFFGPPSQILPGTPWTSPTPHPHSSGGPHAYYTSMAPGLTLSYGLTSLPYTQSASPFSMQRSSTGITVRHAAIIVKVTFQQRSIIIFFRITVFIAVEFITLDEFVRCANTLIIKELDTSIINKAENASVIQLIIQRRWNKPHAGFQSHIGL